MNSTKSYQLTTTNRIRKCPLALKRLRLPVTKHNEYQLCSCCGNKISKAVIHLLGEAYSLICAAKKLEGLPRDTIKQILRLPPPGEGDSKGPGMRLPPPGETAPSDAKQQSQQPKAEFN